MLNFHGDSYTGKAQAAQTLVGEGDVLVAGRWGHFLVPPNDRYIARSILKYGEYNKGEADVLSQLITPGQTVVEVGANLGTHTVMLAKKVGSAGKVYAVEPQRLIFGYLSAQVVLNRLKQVQLLHGALGEKAGTMHIADLGWDEIYNYGAAALESTGTNPVNVMRLDDLGLAACDLIKIDVEGAERAVLMGATDTIEKFRPILYVENDRKDNSPALIEWLFAHDYRVYWDLPYVFSADNYFEDTVNVFGMMCSLNMICVPRERPGAVAREEIRDAGDWLVTDDWRWKDVARANRSSPNPLAE